MRSGDLRPEAFRWTQRHAMPLACLELGLRKPSWPAVIAPHPQAGHMTATAPLTPFPRLLPARGPSPYEFIVHHVIDTKEGAILDDASKPNPFSADGNLRDRKSKSILCLPLINQRELIGVLLLENTAPSSWRCATPEQASIRPPSRNCSNPSTRPRRTAWASACRSAGRLSRPTRDVFGRRRKAGRAPRSASRFLSSLNRLARPVSQSPSESQLRVDSHPSVPAQNRTFGRR